MNEARISSSKLMFATAQPAKSYAILAQLGIKPNKLNIYAAYRTMDIGTNENSDFNAWTLGAN